MDLGIQGKRALVTGSTAGIGLAIAKSLAAEGAHVWINGRTEERVNTALVEIKAHAPSSTIQGIAADLSTAQASETLFAQLPEVDILVNNLGIFETQPFLEIPTASGFASSKPTS